MQDEYATTTTTTTTKPKTEPLGDQGKSSELNILTPFENTTFEKIFFRRK